MAWTTLLALLATLLCSAAAAATNETTVWTPNGCPTMGVTAPRIVHYHQHKAGGKTVNTVLVDRYHGIESHSRTRKALSYAVAKQYKGQRIVTFVREPVSKVLSRFWYWRSGERGKTKTESVACRTLEEYASCCT